MCPLHTLPEFCPREPAGWRRWLRKNHTTREGVWLVFQKKDSGKQGLTESVAVDEPLCWGWMALPAERQTRGDAAVPAGEGLGGARRGQTALPVAAFIPSGLARPAAPENR